MERLIKKGFVIPKSADEIKNSRLGIGFEKLDRAVFEPEKAYDKLAKVGVKWVRIQSGWQRTERVKGVYDFEWIDSIVDNLLARGMQPWICLCYGNDLYTESAKQIFGAVGCPPINTEEEKSAWDCYCREIALHFKGRVNMYEIWNEPDGIWCWKHGVSAEEYGLFAVDTANAIREGDPDAYVIGGSICLRPLSFINTALAVGMSKVINGLTFHEYTSDEKSVYERISALRALVSMYNPEIEIIQGESGSQSRSGGHGALNTGGWTQTKQAKQLLRHAIADLSCNVKFSSYFTCVDMIEALNGRVGDKQSYLDYGYFGILGADFDENGISTGEYTPKPSYYALQNLCSVMAENPESTELPCILSQEYSGWILGQEKYAFDIKRCAFKKENGSLGLFYWNPTDIMTTSFEGTVSLQLVVPPDATICIVDMMDGAIYDLPEKMIEYTGHGCLNLHGIPVKDYPLLLSINGFEK